MEHRRHQRSLLLGQALCRVQKEVAPDSGKPSSTRGARARGSVCCWRSNRPFFRHHSVGLSDLR
jgi:hypothetical protein